MSLARAIPKPQEWPTLLLQRVLNLLELSMMDIFFGDLIRMTELNMELAKLMLAMEHISVVLMGMLLCQPSPIILLVSVVLRKLSTLALLVLPTQEYARPEYEIVFHIYLFYTWNNKFMILIYNGVLGFW